jgi:hypothetical protein
VIKTTIIIIAKTINQSSLIVEAKYSVGTITMAKGKNMFLRENLSSKLPMMY